MEAKGQLIHIGLVERREGVVEVTLQVHLAGLDLLHSFFGLEDVL